MALEQQKMPISTASYHRQPTLPHLLQEYGFQTAITKQQQGKKSEKKEKKVSGKKDAKKSGSFLDDERDVEKEKELDEHYLKMVRDMHHLRDYYYNEYTSLLGDKVEKQRRKMKERDTQLKRSEEKREEEERKASHRVKKRLQRHTLETTPATDSVMKTDLYYIMGLEDKLRKEGKLKTPSDFQKFRKDISEPHVFYANFKVNKNSDPTRYTDQSSVDLMSSFSRGESSDTVFEMVPDSFPKASEQTANQRSLSRISESRESPVPVSQRENWAVTQQFPTQHRSRRSMGQIHAGKGKAEQLSDLEKRFPKLEMPKLHCFTLNLSKKPPDPEEVKQQTDLRAKEKGRRRAMRTYTKMYQLAMTNAATTSRIMDNFEDMNFILQGPDLCDVIADHHWMQAYGLTGQGGEIELDQAEMLAVRQEDAGDVQLRSHESTPMLEEGPASRGGSAVSIGSRKSRRSSAKSQSLTPVEEPQTAIPLTLDEITGGCDIKESKTISSLWNNYMGAGKSPWMRTEP